MVAESTHSAADRASRIIRSQFPDEDFTVVTFARPACTVASIPNGFDTERLHALMRGDPILPGR